ncbi:hypothetical protein H4Q26_014456 [Puccinia striiformis f. sp. tritici PST-130]|nr:hypothetical protein H4Q26_014456 [Puccinia striiformis f. sp. tritici PST-130]
MAETRSGNSAKAQRRDYPSGKSGCHFSYSGRDSSTSSLTSHHSVNKNLAVSPNLSTTRTLLAPLEPLQAFYSFELIDNAFPENPPHHSTLGLLSFGPPSRPIPGEWTSSEKCTRFWRNLSEHPNDRRSPKERGRTKGGPKKEEASKEVKPEEAAKKEDTPKKEASKAEDATKKVEAPKKDEAAKKEDAPKEEGEAKEEEEGAPKSNAPWFNVAKIRESLAGYRKSFDEFTGKVRTAVDMTLGLADMAGIGQGPAADADAEPTTPPTDDKAPTPSTSDAQAPTPPKA